MWRSRKINIVFKRNHCEIMQGVYLHETRLASPTDSFTTFFSALKLQNPSYINFEALKL